MSTSGLFPSQVDSSHPMPTISVIVPVYNRAESLEECLNSILGQTMSSLEVIVVDDHSIPPYGDQIAHMVEKLHDSRLSLLVHKTNRGPGAGRNTGVRAASGQLLLFVDSDDMLHPTFCERLLSHFAKTPDLDIAFTAFELFGSVSMVAFLDLSNYKPWEIQLRMYIPGPGVLMRRSVWERVGGYCEDRQIIAMEDRDFWVATIPLALKEAWIREPLYRWRRHAGTLSSPERLEKGRYKQSLFIVRRHRDTIRAQHAEAPYLADAYFRSARAYRQDGQRLTALWLSTIGLLHNHSEYQHRRQWLELINPRLINLWPRIKALVKR